MKQGQEGSAFWSIFGVDDRPETAYMYNPEWNRLFIDLGRK